VKLWKTGQRHHLPVSFQLIRHRAMPSSLQAMLLDRFCERGQESPSVRKDAKRKDPCSSTKSGKMTVVPRAQNPPNLVQTLRLADFVFCPAREAPCIQNTQGGRRKPPELGENRPPGFVLFYESRFRLILVR
jgi:hypothetical protein